MLEDQTARTDGTSPRIPAQPAADSQPPSDWPTGYPDGYAVVDVETTGLARDDRIVSAAVYRLDARGEVEDRWYTPVNPQRDPGPTWIHGLTAEALADAPLFGEIAEEFATRLAGRVLVAHNAIFDWSMIAREYARAEREAPVRQRLCTIALSKELSLPLPNHKLESLAAHYGVVQQRAHHALDDARVLAEAFRPSLHLAARQRVRLPLLACQPLTEWSDAVVPRRPRPGGGDGCRVPHLRPRVRHLAARAQAPGLPVPQPGTLRTGGAPGAGDAGGHLRGHLGGPGPAGGPGHRGGPPHRHQRLAAHQSPGHQ